MGTSAQSVIRLRKIKSANGIDSIINYYLASSLSSGVLISQVGWTTTTQTTTSEKRYLWAYTKTLYTNGEYTVTDPIIIGTYGQNGSNTILAVMPLLQWTSFIWSITGNYGATNSFSNITNYSEIKVGDTIVIRGVCIDKANASVLLYAVVKKKDDEDNLIYASSISYIISGTDGKGIEFVFSRTTVNDKTQLPTLTNSSSDNYVPSGWTDEQYGVNSAYPYEWVSSRVKTLGTWGNFSEPSLWATFSSDGISSFKSTVFIRSKSLPTTPSGGSYSSPLPTSTPAWSDGIPDGTNILWASTRIFSSDGNAPQQSTWTAPRQLTNTSDISVMYSSASENIGTPTTHPAKWTQQSSSDVLWMAVRLSTNGIWGEWEISRIKGERGATGTSIKIQGTAYGHAEDESGLPSSASIGEYWLVDESVQIYSYAGSGNWNNISAVIGEGYIMTSTGHLWIADNDAWEDVGQIKGDTGPQGVAGDKAYVHIKYSDSPYGVPMNDYSGAYIGTYADNNLYDSEDPTKYTWVKIKGEQGNDAEVHYMVADKLFFNTDVDGLADNLSDKITVTAYTKKGSDIPQKCDSSVHDVTFSVKIDNNDYVISTDVNPITVNVPQVAFSRIKVLLSIDWVYVDEITILPNKQGFQGLKGSISRVFEDGIKSGQTYRNDDADGTVDANGYRFFDCVAFSVPKEIMASGYVVYQTLHTFTSTVTYENWDSNIGSAILNMKNDDGKYVFSQMDINAAKAFFNFILARKIKAAEIDVEGLTVNSLEAKSSDGNTTCSIDGKTGKLTAKNADIIGKITATEGSIGGLRIIGNSLSNENSEEECRIKIDNPNKGIRAWMGTSSAPSTFGANVVATFQNHQPNDSYGNIALLLSAYNSSLSNLALRAIGGVQVTGNINTEGIVSSYHLVEYSFSEANKIKVIAFKETEICNTTIFVYFNFSNCAVALPDRYNVASILGISNTSPFCLSMKIICSGAPYKGTLYGRCQYLDNAIYPFLYRGNDTPQYNGIEMNSMNTISVDLYFNGGEYRAYVTSMYFN